MRNFRKTRKSGGLSVSTILECVPPHKSMKSCEAEFLRRQNFIRIKVPSDGNCFYHALNKYYKLSNPPGSPVPTHNQLRQRVVNKMEDNIDDIRVGLIVNMSNIPNNTEESEREVLEMAKYLEALDDLREDGEWNSDNADIVSQFAAQALNIRIKIFDKKAAVAAKRIFLSRFDNGRQIYANNPAQPPKIICYTFEPEGYGGGNTINLFRISDGHYELLYPRGAAVAPRSRRVTVKKANTFDKKENLVSNTAAKLAAVKLTNKKNNTAKKNNKRGPTTRSRAKAVINNSNIRRKSLENALKIMANQEKKNVAALKKAQAATRKVSPKSRTSSLENALMKIAILESEDQKKKNKEKREALDNNFFKYLEMANFENQ